MFEFHPQTELPHPTYSLWPLGHLIFSRWPTCVAKRKRGYFSDLFLQDVVILQLHLSDGDGVHRQLHEHDLSVHGRA